LALHATGLLTIYSVLPPIKQVEFGGDNQVLEIESAFVSDSAGEVAYEPPEMVAPDDWSDPANKDYLAPPQLESPTTLPKVANSSVVQPNLQVDETPAQPEFIPAQSEIVFRKPTPTAKHIPDRPERRPTRPRPSSLTTQIPGVDNTLPPVFSANTELQYPDEAIRRRLEGEVLLELRVATDGTVLDVKVLRSSGHPVLDRAAVAAVKKWKGQPAMRGGKAVESVERLPVNFRL
jgi:protein TonB